LFNKEKPEEKREALKEKVFPRNTGGRKIMINLEKSSTLSLEKDDNGNEIRDLKIGCGWDMIRGGIDIDLSAAHYDKNGKCLGVTYFGNKNFNGISSSGDNTSGDKFGDDETLSVDFSKISKDTDKIVFFINIFSSGYTMNNMKNVVVNLYTKNAKFADFKITEFGNQRGTNLVELVRNANGTWRLNTLGTSNNLSSASAVKSMHYTDLVK
jgi:tellurium resistance protein TerD